MSALFKIKNEFDFIELEATSVLLGGDHSGDALALEGDVLRLHEGRLIECISTKGIAKAEAVVIAAEPWGWGSARYRCPCVCQQGSCRALQRHERRHWQRWEQHGACLETLVYQNRFGDCKHNTKMKKGLTCTT